MRDALFDHCDIGSDLHIIDVKVRTGLSLVNVGVGGTLQIHDSTIEGAVNADSARVHGILDMRETEVAKEIAIRGAVVDGQMKLDSLEARRVFLTGTTVRNDLFCGGMKTSLFDVEGARLKSVVIDGSVKLGPPELGSRSVLYAQRASVDLFRIADCTQIRGSFNLTGARVGELTLSSNAELSARPDLSATTSLSVDRIEWSPRGKDSSRVASEWLASSRALPGAWVAFANALGAEGDDAAARTLLIEAADRRLKDHPNWFRRTIYRPIMKWTVGHGYRSHRALLWTFGVWVAIWVLVLLNQASFIPGSLEVEVGLQVAVIGTSTETLVADTTVTPQPSEYPVFDAGLYALDVLLAPVDLGQADVWRVSSPSWLMWSLAGLKLAATSFLGLFIAGATGIVAKR